LTAYDLGSSLGGELGGVRAAVALEDMETFGSGLDHSEGICLAPDGNLYVGGEAGQLYQVNDDGAVMELLSTGGFLLGLAADHESRIYAIDLTAKCVWRIDPRDWSKEIWAEGFDVPNWGAFDSEGNYFISDSGGWGAADGKIWRIPPGGRPELWSSESCNFPNGLALSPNCSSLYVLESLPAALVEIPIEANGSAGRRRLLCKMGISVPDGIALAENGSFYIACYRPDAIFRWHPTDGLSIFAEDPRGTVLSAPTNVVFTGTDRDVIVVPNLGRWHLTRIKAGVRGVSLNYPTREQLSG
jgi:sugar lactone lactonase YvrE